MNCTMLVTVKISAVCINSTYFVTKFLTSITESYYNDGMI